MPIYEPHLSDMVQKNLEQKRLKFVSSSEEAIQFGDVIFIAVGTPPLENGEANLNNVIAVAEDIGQHISSYKVIVNKSTVINPI